MKKNKLLGYLIGIICGFLFSIPWLLIYIIFNLSIVYLSILIVFGIIIGYKLVCKEIYNDSKTRIYLILTSAIITAINVFIFVPIITISSFNGINTLSGILSNKEIFSIKYLVEFYNSKTYIETAIINSIISFVMVLIPAIFLPIDYKKSENEDSKEQDFETDLEKVFDNYNAYTKQTAVDKNVIKEELKKIEPNNLKRFIYIDLLKGIKIKSYKKKVVYKI